MVEPKQIHWVAAKHMFRYLHNIFGHGLRYVSRGEVRLQGHTNSDWVGNAEDKRTHQDVAIT